MVRIGNFAAEPRTTRSQSMWVSARDLAALVYIGLTQPDIKVTTVFGVSAGAEMYWDNTEAQRLGYSPADTIRGHIPTDGPIDPPSELHPVAQHFIGGAFCLTGHDGIVRNR